MPDLPDLSRFREDFPILRREVNGHKLVYLDSAATSLKPQAVVDAVVRFYTECTANVHRAVHALSEEATELFENARESVARFINAENREIVFVRHATEALNMVAASLRERGCVVAPLSEHHSNLLPWRNGESLQVPVTPEGMIDLDAARTLIKDHRPGLVTFSTVSNAWGTRQPVTELTAMAREVGALVLLDVSQSIGHEPIDVRQLDCDFACFSGHKMLGPSGVGVLYCRESVHDRMTPLLLGGSMVHQVHADSYEPLPFPWSHEAGTPNIEGVIGLGAACDYLEEVGPARIHDHGQALIEFARTKLAEVPDISLLGDVTGRPSSILAFSVEGIEAHGMSRILSSRFGIMARSGYHCAQPLHEACGTNETVRISTHLYNHADDIRHFVDSVETVVRMS
jgi:cysteine desulfurase/selenocysteine lyase